MGLCCTVVKGSVVLSWVKSRVWESTTPVGGLRLAWEEGRWEWRLEILEALGDLRADKGLIGPSPSVL